MSHPEFIELCKANDIPIIKITRGYVHMAEDKMSKQAHTLLPNKLNDVQVFAEWVDSYGFAKDELTIERCIIEEKRITAIKIVRSQADLGLKDAKDIVCDNWNDWQALYRE